MVKRIFNKKEKEFIRNNYLKMPSRILGEKLGCSKSVVLKYLKQNNMVVPKDVVKEFSRKAMLGKTTLTKEEDKYLLDNYLTMPIKRIGKHLGRSFGCLKARLDFLGLEIPEEIVEKRKRAGRFKKGMVPANKGKKMEEFMDPEILKKFKANQFKKGDVPHNAYSKDGVVSVRVTNGIPYQYIRISLGEWKPLHHHIWEEKHGAIPKKHVVIFKDGNSMNCVLNNLEIITKKENMKRNTIHQYPKDLQETIKLNNKIKQILKKHE